MSAVPATKPSMCPECGQEVAVGDPIVFIDDAPIHESCEASCMSWDFEDERAA